MIHLADERYARLVIGVDDPAGDRSCHLSYAWHTRRLTTATGVQGRLNVVAPASRKTDSTAAAVVLRGRPRSVSSQAPDLAEREMASPHLIAPVITTGIVAL